MPEQVQTIEAYTGDEVAVEPIKQLSNGGTRVELDVVEGPRWRLDVNGTGNDYEIVTSWDATGQLADVDVPGWIDDILVRLRQV